MANFIKGEGRNPLAFPYGTVAGFDPSHPAACRPVSADHYILSAVASGAAFRILYAPYVTGAPTIAGTPSAVIDGRIGPTVKFLSGASYTWTVSTSISAVTGTGAAIFVANSLGPSNQYLFEFGGLAFGVFDSSAVQLVVFDAASTLAVSGLSLSVGVPYFAIWSVSAGAVNFLLKRLDTGVIKTATTAGMATNPIIGNFIVGGDTFGDPCLSNIAALAYVPAFLSFPQMKQWAADPWSFWYPQRSVQRVGAAAVVTPQVNTNFLGKFTASAHRILPALRSNIAADFTTLPTQPEAQPHFIGRFTQPQHRVNPQLRLDIAADFSSGTTFETNTHFIGRFSPTQFNIWAGLRLNIAADFSSVTPQIEANPHFIAKFSSPNYRVLTTLRQNAAIDVPFTAVAETNTHFIGRFVPVQFTIPPLLRTNVAADASAAQTQPETNTHFLGRFTQPQFAIPAALRSNIAADFSSAIQPETNTHFIGRFAPVSFTIQTALRSNIAADFSSLQAQAETNANFLGRHSPVVYNLYSGARQNQATDLLAVIVAETNANFLGRHSPVAYTLYSGFRQNQAADILAVIVAEVNASFIGRFSPVQHSVLPALRSNIAADFSVLQAQSETNTNFLGHFTPVVFTRGFAYNIRPTDDGSSTPPAPPPGLHAPHFFSTMGMSVGAPANPPS